jgi:hypothetical protein
VTLWNIIKHLALDENADATLFGTCEYCVASYCLSAPGTLQCIETTKVLDVEWAE